MRTTAAIIIGVSAATGAGAILGTQTVEEIAAPIKSNGEWIRLAVTLITLLVAAYVIFKDRSAKAMKGSVEALNNAVAAHKVEASAYKERLEHVEKERALLQGECTALKAKTDISEVIKLLTQLSTAVSQEQTRAMEVMQMMLKNNSDQLIKNQEVLDAILKIVSGWKLDRRSSLRKSESGAGKFARGREDGEG